MSAKATNQIIPPNFRFYEAPMFLLPPFEWETAEEALSRLERVLMGVSRLSWDYKVILYVTDLDKHHQAVRDFITDFIKTGRAGLQLLLRKKFKNLELPVSLMQYSHVAVWLRSDDTQGWIEMGPLTR